MDIRIYFTETMHSEELATFLTKENSSLTQVKTYLKTHLLNKDLKYITNTSKDIYINMLFIGNSHDIIFIINGKSFSKMKILNGLNYKHC